ncbi:uncharacterized protein METZ01_LOCUS483698 [marine metagenome]|uniref:Uncharacterized protein n=1 Tax=marine metagenome TaxID=408172 RepID=A0A383CFD5_9ZZZZ
MLQFFDLIHINTDNKFVTGEFT